MFMIFSMNDPEANKRIQVDQGGLEYVGDVAELFLTFLQGVGYTYIKQIVLIKDDGEELATVR